MNIAEVLQVVHNPRTPEAAKQQTLRRLDGLEGRRAPIPKRHSMDHNDRGRENQRSDELDKSRSSSAGPGERGRVAMTEGASPLLSRKLTTGYSGSLFPDGSPPVIHSRTNTEGRGTHSDPPSMSRSPSGGRRRVTFMDEWELAGQDVILNEETSDRDALRQN
ncbi:uncharacterized protein FOMMEDRAFT_28810 [Fomitiporia mediterranea MF3/22]|uniref:uncharacterized protein n=1 Tax=Fomitiporia mediterranea (strain MF3/22) TaxID=694068 RepID=UPI0004409595|nr:uncharacterized protein FOMMEDRAFT_28810 [Fomitiporia mediterranea MF3/22]EJD03278.1 hypothetical protein FOMMEDRAFT_28810 [Fomitiporia mediterranea MF3/22]